MHVATESTFNAKEEILNIKGLLQEVRNLKLEEETLEKALGSLKKCIVNRNSAEEYRDFIISLWNDASRFDKLIERFIGCGIYKKEDYTTYLHLLAEYSSPKVVEDILDQKRSKDPKNPNVLKKLVNERNKDQEGLLHCAARGGKEKTVALLIDAGADVHGKNKYKLTPLHLAAEKGHLEIVEKLLDKGAKVNAQTKDQLTPLHLAVQNGHLKSVEKLLDKGADVNAADKREYTPLHFAAKGGNIEVVQVLLKDDKINVNAETDHQVTPLHFAAKNGHLEIVKALIGKGADVNIKDEGDFTPLHSAAWYNHVDVVNALLEVSKIDVNAKTTEDKTPLDLAQEKLEENPKNKGLEEIVNLLEQRSAETAKEPPSGSVSGVRTEPARSSGRSAF
ncbi:ankyrin repeat domain-containing protein [Wolbachia endosymbiont of Cantharis cryptica]|uniref:ankyrin repeat domain-containing protein n=1 Tax=Wolbachia endosymbiont of Cantharis cryptica TaxID=3066132 RepID=UPI00376EA8C5